MYIAIHSVFNFFEYRMGNKTRTAVIGIDEHNHYLVTFDDTSLKSIIFDGCQCRISVQHCLFPSILWSGRIPTSGMRGKYHCQHDQKIDHNWTGLDDCELNIWYFRDWIRQNKRYGIDVYLRYFLKFQNNSEFSELFLVRLMPSLWIFE